MAKTSWRLSVEERVHIFSLYEHIAKYVFAAQFVEGKVVLDISCGIGYGSSDLMNKAPKVVIGGDNSVKAIEYKRLHYPKDELHFLCLEAQQMPFRDNSFDIAVSLETIERLERYEDFLKECNRKVKEGGIFIRSTPNREGGSATKTLYILENPQQRNFVN